MLRLVQRNPRPFDAAAAEGLLPDYSGFLARLLYSRGIETREAANDFLHPSLEKLHDPMLLSGMSEAVALLEEARAKQWSVTIFGDYDADGVCASVLLAEALEHYGIQPRIVSALRSEGYGLKMPALDRIHAAGCDLLITVDLGISNAPEVLYAKELGMRVIVTDHHGLGLEPCPADAVINPLLGEYPFRSLCGTGVAFKVAQQLLGLEKCRELLDLAAIATVADLVPLLDENRILVTFGLKQLDTRSRPGLNALMEISRIEGDVTSGDLGYRIGPRLNSAGRITTADTAVRLLRASDPAEAEQLALLLDETNTRRKAVEASVTSQAEQQLANHDFSEEPALLLCGEGWHHGVVGLTAGKMTQKYSCPCGILSLDDGQLVGSFRSVPGLNVHDTLQACNDLLLFHGGHELAGGATLYANCFAAFNERFQQEARRADPRCFLPMQEYDLPLRLSECNEILLSRIEQMEPFGLGNPAPLFLLEDAGIGEARAVGADRSHLKLRLNQGNSSMDGIGFGLGEMAGNMTRHVNCVFSLGRNVFRGITTLQMEVKAICPSNAYEAAASEAGVIASSLLESLRLLNLDQMPRASCEIRQESWDDLQSSFGKAFRGQLLLSRSNETAERVLALFPELDCVSHQCKDLRCLPTLICRPDFAASPGMWRNVWLLDGELLPGECERWQALYPQAHIHVLPPSGEVCAILREAVPSLEELRLLWVQAHPPERQKKLAEHLPASVQGQSLPFPKQFAGHIALCETGWLAFSGSYLPQNGTVSPDTAPFLSALHQANQFTGSSAE